jgi:hypothetical protein
MFLLLILRSLVHTGAMAGIDLAERCWERKPSAVPKSKSPSRPHHRPQGTHQAWGEDDQRLHNLPGHLLNILSAEAFAQIWLLGAVVELLPYHSPDRNVVCAGKKLLCHSCEEQQSHTKALCHFCEGQRPHTQTLYEPFASSSKTSVYIILFVHFPKVSHTPGR